MTASGLLRGLALCLAPYAGAGPNCPAPPRSRSRHRTVRFLTRGTESAAVSRSRSDRSCRMTAAPSLQDRAVMIRPQMRRFSGDRSIYFGALSGACRPSFRALWQHPPRLVERGATAWRRMTAARRKNSFQRCRSGPLFKRGFDSSCDFRRLATVT